MENWCLFKIADKSEIGIIISSKEMIWKDVWHVKIHLIESKINPNKIRPYIDYLFAVITCYGSRGLPTSGFTRCYIDLKTLISFLHTSKAMSWRRIFSSINEQSIGDKFLYYIKKYTCCKLINTHKQCWLIMNQNHLIFFAQNMSQWHNNN